MAFHLTKTQTKTKTSNDPSSWSKGRPQKKNTGLFGNFSQIADPPPPPFGNFDHFLPIFFWSSRKFLGDFELV